MASQTPEPKRLEENDQVLLKKGKSCQVFQIKKKRYVWLDKVKFTLDGIIGFSYGTTFRVSNGEMVRVKSNELEEEYQSKEQGKDNRGLHDLDSNQKLSRDDIEQMKSTGMEGEEIIEQLIENSTTFKEKTEYAQEKWIKKKKKKHLQIFTVLKPTARLLCEMYHGKSPAKICHMRVDTLAQILTYSNVHSGCNMAIVDTCNGLVVSSVLERLGGNGKVVHFFAGESTRPALDAMNFSQDVLENLYNFPLNQINGITNTEFPCDQQSENKNTETDSSMDTQSESRTENESNEKDENKNKDDENSSEKDKVNRTNQQGKKRRKDRECRENNRQLRNKRIREAKQLLVQRNMDGLIVACKYHPTPIVLALLDYIAPSRPVVIYSQYKEPLMDCYAYMRERGGLVSFRLTETWLREYQVLPMRTHPLIGMSGGGGYLLTATTIVKPAE